MPSASLGIAYLMHGKKTFSLIGGLMAVNCMGSQIRKKMSPNKHIQDSLVGGFNPSEKYNRQDGFIFPKFRGESQKYVNQTFSHTVDV